MYDSKSKFIESKGSKIYQLIFFTDNFASACQNLPEPPVIDFLLKPFPVFYLCLR